MSTCDDTPKSYSRSFQGIWTSSTSANLLWHGHLWWDQQESFELFHSQYIYKNPTIFIFRDVKNTVETQISVIGGTMGLFSGVYLKYPLSEYSPYQKFESKVGAQRDPRHLGLYIERIVVAELSLLLSFFKAFASSATSRYGLLLIQLSWSDLFQDFLFSVEWRYCSLLSRC